MTSNLDNTQARSADRSASSMPTRADRRDNLDIPVDKVRTLILEARRMGVKEANTDPQSGSDGSDDRFVDVLSSNDPGEASEHEFRGLIAGLNIDERAGLLALLYIGRGDFAANEWKEARRIGRERDASSPHLGNYLVGTPNLPDLLAEGLASLGWAVDDEGGEEGASPDDGVEIHRLPARNR